MKIKDIILEMNSFDANMLVVICYFGGAFGANYYRKVVNIKEISIVSSKLPTHQNSNKHIKVISLITSELNSDNKDIISVNDILFILSKFDKESELYCITDDFNENTYSSVSEIACIIDGDNDPDLKEFKVANREQSIVEIVV